MKRDSYRAERENLLQKIKNNKTEISILDQVQETHFIVPADNAGLIEKAVQRGCSQSLDLLGRYNISLDELAHTLECEAGVIKAILENNSHADLILIDGEDATSLKEENILAARKNIISTFNSRTNYNSRIYFRPSGLELQYCIDDIVEVFSGVKSDSNNRYPVDGMIYPKVEDPDEIRFIDRIIRDVEAKNQIPENTIKLQFLIESSCGVENLYEIAGACKNRLSGIIFGMADYAADIGISSLDENHVLFQYARMRIINVSAAYGVPSIDCMSFRYPVADKSLDVSGNKTLILGKIREVFDITTNSILLGMKGKWVGHPLQLLAAKVAFEKHFSDQILNEEIEKLNLYLDSAAGASIIRNDMADRATDRKVRSFLRRAVMKKKIDPERALKLNLIDQKEFILLTNSR